MNLINLKTFLLILSFFLATTVFSQQSAALVWSTNYDDVLNQAKLQKQLVLLFFHGSDWFPPCIQLQKKVLHNPAFIDSAVVSLNKFFLYYEKIKHVIFSLRNA